MSAALLLATATVLPFAFFQANTETPTDGLLALDWPAERLAQVLLDPGEWSPYPPCGRARMGSRPRSGSPGTSRARCCSPRPTLALTARIDVS